MKYEYGVNLLTTFTNMRGLLSNLGYERGLCQYFKAFSPVEMMAFVRLTMLNVLMSSMRLESKFKTQEEDPTVRNHLYSMLFGENANKWSKEFKLCVSLLILELNHPQSRKLPNQKA